MSGPRSLVRKVLPTYCHGDDHGLPGDCAET
jgi:hypothetical protein